MQQNFPFQPVSGASTTSSIAVTGTSQELTLSPKLGSDGGTMRIMTDGTQKIYWCYGAGPATTSSTPMLANIVETFSLPGGVNSISVIAGGTGTTLSATVGIGQ